MMMLTDFQSVNRWQKKWYKNMKTNHFVWKYSSEIGHEMTMVPKFLKRYRWITVSLCIRNRRDKKKFRSSFRSVSLWSYLQQINNHFRITNVGSAQRGAWAHEIKFHDQTNKHIGTMMIKKTSCTQEKHNEIPCKNWE